jgi:outer membrane immunogenic protein
MNQLVLGGVAFLALIAGPAIAADMPVKAPILKAPPPPLWTGFYIGGNIGYSWGRSNSTLTFTDATSGAVLAATSNTFNLDGLIGGGQIGHNWQSGSWVFGLEADIQASDQNGDTNSICPGGTAATPTVNGTCSRGHVGDTINDPAVAVTDGLSERLKWFGTARVRVGPTVVPTLLVYATGGLAYGGVSVTDIANGTNVAGFTGANGATLTTVAGALNTSTTRLGWTIGGGIEGMLGKNWTAKIEYLYIDLGSVSGTFTTPIIAPSGAFVAAGFTSHITDNILRVGINLKFDGT